MDREHPIGISRVFSYSLKDICVLIPAYNEELVIEDTLRSVRATGIPTENIFVLDDCSTDRTGEIVQSMKVQVLRNTVNLKKTRTVEKALNTLKPENRFIFTAILDADTILHHDFFFHILNAFVRNPEAAAICGQPKSIKHNWITSWRALEYALCMSLYKSAQSTMGVIMVSPGCGTVYLSSVLSELEFHPDDIIIEDTEATAQIHRRNLGKIVYEPNAIVYTQDPYTLESFVQQINRWYTGVFQTMRLYRIPLMFKRIDFEFMLVIGEGFLYSMMVCLLPLWLIMNVTVTLYALLCDQIIWLLIALYFSLTHGRIDILLYFPLFVIPRFLNRITFVVCFWNIIICRKGMTTWYQPDRYAIQKTEK